MAILEKGTVITERFLGRATDILPGGDSIPSLPF